MTNWKNRLNATIKEKQLTQKQVADLAGVCPSTINGWTAGAFPHDPILVKRFCEKIGISFCWLITGEHETASVEAVFDRADGWEGFAEITIKRLVPRSKI